MLLKVWALDPLLVDAEGNGLLHMACRSGNVNLLKYLVKKVQLNYFLKNDDGYTPLHSAIMSGAIGLPLIRFLIDECRGDLICKIDSSVMTLAFHSWNRNVIKCLLDKGNCSVFVDDGDTILHKLCRKADVGKLKFLLNECKCDPNIQNKSGDTILHELCMLSHVNKIDLTDFVKYLITMCKCDPNIKNGSGDTMLDALSKSLLTNNGFSNLTRCSLFCHMITRCQEFGIEVKNCKVYLIAACFIIRCGYYNFLSLSALSHLILYLGANPRIVKLPNDADTILHVLCSGVYSGPQNHVTDLLSHLIDTYKCNAIQKNNHGHTALDRAVKQGSKALTIVHYLIKIYKRDNGHLLKHDTAKTMTIAYQYWNGQIMKCLILEGGFAVTLEDGSTLLHRLCQDSKIEELKFMLEECKCDPNVQDKHGNTILHEICLKLSKDKSSDVTHWMQLIEYLTPNYKCDISLINSDDHNVLHLSVVAGHKGILFFKHFIGKCGCHQLCEQNRVSIMTLAYHYWCKDFMKLLQEENCGLMIENGDTILHVLCRNGDTESVKFLLEDCKCDPNIQDKNGDTILHLICTLQHQSILYHVEFMRYLISKCKCNPNLKNGKGETVYNILYNALCSGGYETSDCRMLCYVITHSKFPCAPRNNFLSGLCRAIQKGCYYDIQMLSALKQLIECGSNPHIKLDNGDTLLHLLFGMAKQVSEYRNRVLNFFLYLVKVCDCDPNIKIGGLPLVNAFCISASARSYSPSMIDLLQYLIVTSSCEVEISDKIFLVLYNAIARDSKVALDVVYFLTRSKDVKTVSVAVFTLCCRNEYSYKLIHLFHYFLNECDYDITSRNENGNTSLHFACLFYDGDTSMIECILSAKADPLCLNYNNQTPLDLLKINAKSLSQQALVNAKTVISRFGKVKMSHPVESYVNVIFLGNPGVGKSSLVKVIIDQPNFLPVLMFQRFKYVSEVELLTAGIVPHVLDDRTLGRVILHDLAGHVEYYSSHSAVLANLLQNLPAVFVIVISLVDHKCIDSLHLWLSILENLCCNNENLNKRENQIIVVCSHYEQPPEKRICSLADIRQLLLKRVQLMRPHVEMSIHSPHVFGLDCRRLGGGHLHDFMATLSNLSNIVRTSNKKELSLYCHMLYEHLMKKKNEKNIYSLGSLMYSLVESVDSSLNFLPTDINLVLRIVVELSQTGLIIFLRNERNLSQSWIVVDKSILLKKLNGILFAPRDFKEHREIASNTGIVALSDLASLFREEKECDPDLLIQFLQYMDLANVVSDSLMSVLNLAPLHSPEPAKNDEGYLFIPALIGRADKPVINDPFEFGWCLKCVNTHHIFSPNFFHVILLHLAQFMESASNRLQRICTVWKNGMFWNTTVGVQTLVEVGDNGRCLLLLMSFKEGCVDEMISLRESVITTILTCKEQLCPNIPLRESVIDQSILRYPISSLDDRCLYNIELLAKCYIRKKSFIVNSTKQKYLGELFKFAPSEAHSESVFAGRDPKVKYYTYKNCINYYF